MRGGVNLFGYVKNNPVNKIDPSGLVHWEEGKGVAGGWVYDYGDEFIDPWTYVPLEPFRGGVIQGYDKYFHYGIHKSWPISESGYVWPFDVLGCRINCIASFLIIDIPVHAGAPLVEEGLGKLALKAATVLAKSATKLGKKAIPYAGWGLTMIEGKTLVTCWIKDCKPPCN